MNLKLKIFIIGTAIILLLALSIFVFIPKQKSIKILEAPLQQTTEK